MSAESIFNKPLSKKQKAVLSRIAKRQAAGDDSEIDYSEISRLTGRQLMRYGHGYSTRINSILRTVMERAR